MCKKTILNTYPACSCFTSTAQLEKWSNEIWKMIEPLPVKTREQLLRIVIGINFSAKEGELPKDFYDVVELYEKLVKFSPIALQKMEEAFAQLSHPIMQKYGCTDGTLQQADLFALHQQLMAGAE